MPDSLEDRLRSIERGLAPLGAKLESLGDRVGQTLDSLRPDLDDSVELDLVTHPDGRMEFLDPETSTPDDASTHARVRFCDLPGNTIHEGLEALDRKLTPHQGLRVLTADGTLVPAVEHMQGKTLVVVHGTFSNCDNVLAGIAEGDPEFLRWARQRYAQVLTFDYASLSGRSVSSAMALQRTITQRVDGDVDLLCHSQGGLLARYWLERFEPARLLRSRVILVGSPLAGTSLASPSNLRHALRLLAAAASVVGVGAQVASGLTLLAACGGLTGVLHKTIGMGAIGGLIDAAVGVIPGIDSMSRTSTNTELRELRLATTGIPPGYFAISGDYETPPQWRRPSARKLREVAMDDVVDQVFPGRNDLIVDTDSHTELSDAHDLGRNDPGRVLRFSGGTVHHRNYFSQPDAMTFIARCLHAD